MSEDKQQVINRVLLKYGAMFDTTMDEEMFNDMFQQVADERVVLHGVFGEKLITKAGNLLGFISRKDLDVEKAMQAAQNAKNAMQGAGMQRGPQLSVPGGGRPY